MNNIVTKGAYCALYLPLYFACYVPCVGKVAFRYLDNLAPIANKMGQIYPEKEKESAHDLDENIDLDEPMPVLKLYTSMRDDFSRIKSRMLMKHLSNRKRVNFEPIVVRMYGRNPDLYATSIRMSRGNLWVIVERDGKSSYVSIDDLDLPSISRISEKISYSLSV